MLTLALILSVAMQDVPAVSEATPPPPAVEAAAPVSAEVTSIRFCTAVMMLAQGMAAEQAGPDSGNAMMAQSMVDLFQNERSRLNDTDDAAIETLRAELIERATAAGGPAGLTAERARFEAECLPFIMRGRGG